MIRADSSGRPTDGRLLLAPLLLAIAASLSFSAPARTSSSPAPPSAPGAAERLAVRVEEARKLVERVRGVAFRSPVESALLPEKDLPRVLERQLARDLPTSVPRYAASLAAIGLIDPEPDLGRKITNLYARQVVGFYDPAQRRFFVVPERSREVAGMDLVPGGAGLLETALLSHELTHALQDQRLGLETRMKDLRDSTDGLLALQAFLEGEASVVMAEALFASLPTQARAPAGATGLAEMLKDLASVGAGAVDGSDGVPEYFVREMVFPYAAGTAWIERKRAGRGWTAIDEIYAGRLPSSTSEFLHPEVTAGPGTHLALRDRPAESDLPQAARLLYADTMGEWVLSFLLERAGAEALASPLASAWRDDRVLFFETPSGSGFHVGFLWRIRLSSAETAGRLAAALRLLYAPRPAPARPSVTVRGDVVTVSRLLAPPPSRH